jgi:hypothetical protein
MCSSSTVQDVAHQDGSKGTVFHALQLCVIIHGAAVIPPPCHHIDITICHTYSKKQNQNLHICVQNVQITRMINNMVNRYNISLNYKLESTQK